MLKIKYLNKIYRKINLIFNFQNISDFVQDSMDIIMEADTLNFDTSGKIILSTPYHYDDPIAKACTNEIKQIIKNQLSINVSVL